MKENPVYNPNAVVGKEMRRLDSYPIGDLVKIFPFQSEPEVVRIIAKINTPQRGNPMVKLADGRIIAGATAARQSFY